jgi:hypothetical protein
MSQCFDANTGKPLGDDPDTERQPTQRPTVDLAPCHFSGTFQNPCFWILVGVAATLAVQYVFTNAKKNA